MFAFFCLFMLYIYLIQLESPKEVLNEITSFLSENSNPHPILLTDLFIKFMNNFKLFDVTVESDKHLIELVLKLVPDTDVNLVQRIYPQFLKHNIHTNMVKSRNSLIYYLSMKTGKSCLDKSSLLKSFFETHTPQKVDVATFTDFKKFMRKIDHRLEPDTLQILYPSIIEYQEYLDRLPSRELLQVEIKKPVLKKSEEIKNEMNDFISKYKFEKNDVSELKTFRKLFYDVDFSASDDDSKELHPFVSKYTSIRRKESTRLKLMEKIKKNPLPKSSEIEEEMFQFISSYNLIASDVSDFEKFKKLITDQDDTVEDISTLESLYIEMLKYFQYKYKIKVKEILLEFIRKYDNRPFKKISDIIEPLISAYNLLDSEYNSIVELKNFLYNQDQITTLKEAENIFEIYSKYLKYLSRFSTTFRLLSLIDTLPHARMEIFTEVMVLYINLYNIKNYGISNIESFIKVIRLMDSEISITKIKKIHPYVVYYIQYAERKKAFDELLHYLKAEKTFQPKLKNLLENLIYFLNLKLPHLSKYDKFEAVISELYTKPNKEDVSRVFSKVSEYYIFKNLKKETLKVIPGDINPDGSIVPPNDEKELFWYNVFNFFGLKSYLWKGQNFNDLYWVQIQFNKVYKYFTGIEYYVYHNILSKIATYPTLSSTATSETSNISPISTTITPAPNIVLSVARR